MKNKAIIQFIKRWEEVNRIEHKELMKMSFKEKLLKTTSVMQLGFGLGYSMDKDTINEISEVRNHWLMLKRALK